MPRPAKPRILITGASAGIGQACARVYAQRGWDLILTARRREPMEHLGAELAQNFNTDSQIVTADLAAADGAKALLNACAPLQIDGLINNAGYGMPGRFLDSPWDNHAAFLQLMLTAPVELSRALAGPMAERGFGRIINVASLAGFIPGSKGHTQYGAVKSFLIKFSESLNMELAEAGVHVTALCPGFTLSEFHDVNGTRAAVSQLPEWMWMDAPDVAEAGYYASEKNRAVFIPGKANKSIAALTKILPNALALKIMDKRSESFRKG